MAATTVELLYFDGCPNHRAARALIERVAAATGTELDLRLVEVESADEAERLRFLGSPSMRVNGRDVEPGADARESFVLACRVYRTESGLSGVPSEGWVTDAVEAS